MPSPILPHPPDRRRSCTASSEKFILFPASPLLSPLRDKSPNTNKRRKKKKAFIFSFHYYRSNSKEKDEAPPPLEPSSPKISCIGQVISKQTKDKKAKKDENRRGNFPLELETDVSLPSSCYDDGVGSGSSKEKRRSGWETKKYANLFRGLLLRQHVNEEEQTEIVNDDYVDEFLHHQQDSFVNDEVLHHHQASVSRHTSNDPSDLDHQNLSRNHENRASYQNAITLKELLHTENPLPLQPPLSQKTPCKSLPSLHFEGSHDSRMIVSYDIVPETWILQNDESSSSSTPPPLLTIVPKRSNSIRRIKQELPTNRKDSSINEGGSTISSSNSKLYCSQIPHHLDSSYNHQVMKCVQMNESECTDYIPVLPFPTSNFNRSKSPKRDETNDFQCLEGNTMSIVPPTDANANVECYGLLHSRENVKGLALMCYEKNYPTSDRSSCMTIRTDYGFALAKGGGVQRLLLSPISSRDEHGFEVVRKKNNERPFPVQFLTRVILLGLDNPKQIYHEIWEARLNAGGSTLFCPTGKHLHWLRGGAGAKLIRSFSATSHRTTIIQLQRSNSEPCKCSC